MAVPVEMPPAAQPQGNRGRLSYTISFRDRRIEVLLHGRAFRIKPSGADEGKHVPWAVHGGAAGAWEHVLELLGS
jgi:hypothetical protein